MQFKTSFATVLCALLIAPAAGEEVDPQCQSDLTCVRSSPAVLKRERAQVPDLALWQPVANAAAAIGTGQGPAAEGPAARLAEPLLGTDLVLIPAACYRPPEQHGATAPAPAPVCIKPFYMGVHEVSFDAFDRFTEATSREPADDEGWGRGSRPVINVNLYDALGFAKWLSKRTGAHYRLPTETEWEHAARAGSRGLYPWGDALGTGRANCAGCGSPWDGESTAPVGSFPPNAWGLYDMVGNVGEWTCSMRDPDPAHSFEQCDSIYETRRRVFRNGGWSDRPARLQLAARDWNAAMRRTDDVGFRLVRECPACAAPSIPDQSPDQIHVAAER